MFIARTLLDTSCSTEHLSGYVLTVFVEFMQMFATNLQLYVEIS